GVKEWAGAFVKYFAGNSSALKLPLDVTGTAFQWKVWKKIQSIPYGKTATYSGIADALGSPNASRAVARACATNHVALVIPCHRVIGKDGGLHGYRWGNERKLTLLKLEQKTPVKQADSCERIPNPNRSLICNWDESDDRCILTRSRVNMPEQVW